MRRGVALCGALAGILVLATCDLDKIASPAKANGEPLDVVVSINGDSLVTLGASQILSISSPADLSRVLKRWSSADPTIATVDSLSGRVRGLKVGTTSIALRLLAAELDTGIVRQQSVRVRYKGIKLAAIDSLPGLGLSRAALVTGTDSAGALVQPPLAGPGLVLTSRDTTRFTVSGASVVARANGTAFLVAVFDNLRDSVLLKVRQVAKRIVLPTTEYVVSTLNANRLVPITVTDVADATIVVPTLSWRAADTTVASINSSTGMLRGKKVDTTTIFATMDTVTRFVRLRLLQVPASIAKTAGDNQTDTVLRILPTVPVVSVLDSGGTPVPNVPVAFAVPSGGGSITGTTTNTNALGLATLGSWRLSGVAGQHTVRATAGTLSTLFTATALPLGVAKLAFEAHPVSTTVDGTIGTVRVSIQDSLSNVVTSATDSVAIALAVNTSGAVLSGTRKVKAVNGVATFSDLAVPTSGAGYTLSAAAGGLVAAISNAFDVFGTPTKLVFVAQPSTVAVGVAMSPSVRVAIQDAQGNTVPGASADITISLATNPGGAALSGTLLASSVNSAATFFNLKLSAPASGYRFLASAPGFVAATSAPFDVPGVGPPKRLSFATQPSNVVAGASIAPGVQVAVTDSLGAIVTTATNAVIIALDSITNTGNASLGGTLTVNAVAGIATFPDLAIAKAATDYRLVANAVSLVSKTSGSFNIAAGAAAKLGFIQHPTHTAIGQSMAPAVTVAIQDANGNAVTSAAQTSVSLTIAGCSAALAGATTAVSTNGVASFSNLSIATQASNCSLTASAPPLGASTSTLFNILNSGPVKLAFVAQPGSVVAGNALGIIRVALQDASGTTVTAAPATIITLGIGTNPGNGTLGGSVTATTASGIATFSGNTLTVAASGYTLAASATGYPNAASSAFNISPSAVARLDFVQLPTATDAGVLFSPAVRVAVQDQFMNTVTIATDSVALVFATSPPSATWWDGAVDNGARNSVPVKPTNGIATFTNMRLKKAGAYSVYACTPAPACNTPGTVTSSASPSFSVNRAPSSKLAFSSAPTSPAAGATFGVSVEVRDSVDNLVLDASASVTLSLTGGDASATLSGTKTVIPVGGIASFSGLSIDKSGNAYTLNASASGVPTSTSSSFAVNAGAASRLVLTTTATGAASGAAFTTQPVVAIRDAAGNTVTSDNSTVVTMTVSTGATVVGTATATATAGVATFTNVGISGTAGAAYTLTYSASGLTSATQSITPTAGTASQLVMTTNAAGAASGAAFTTQPVVAVRDAAGNTVTTDNSTAVTMTVSTGATVVGTAAATATAGVAAFTNIGISGTAGTSYTLTFSKSGLSPTTQSITAMAGAFTALTASYHSCGLMSGGAAYCWGRNDVGQLGDGTTTDRLTPVAVQGGLVFTAVTSGYRHSCGLTSAGAAFCWGDNSQGSLGDGTEGDRLTPAAVQGGHVFTSLTAGNVNACGLTSAGVTYCWGEGGTTGDGTAIRRRAPVAVQGGLVFASLTAGGSATCGLTSAGTAYCWGYNDFGALGDGTTTNRFTPVAVQGGIVFTALTAGYYFNCGLSNAGAAYCWGYNEDGGRLGDGTTTNRLVPVAVQGGLVFTRLEAGYHHVCGLTGAGLAYCWGTNGEGGLGDGTTVGRLGPVAVQGGLAFTALTGGNLNTCALTSVGAAYCWGYNYYGQLGDGTTTSRLTPVAVIRP